jgi:hypothetical protein
MGSEERRGALFNCKEEGRDHSGWKKEAFAANEGTVGCTEEIDQEEVNVPVELAPFHARARGECRKEGLYRETLGSRCFL